ncbi:MAG: cyclic nucleotide-binding domain-containing protein [Bdellovibrionales bacterium]|nr:cyclic nucleotide-binding domain-containing protein [Bdellovibrionales bacterium]
MEPTKRYYRAGQHLFREGESSQAMYLIKKGSVSIRKMKGSAFVEIAKVYGNEVIGELSFFDRMPRSAAAVALSEVEALEIDFRSLETVWAKVPDYWKTIMKAVAERLRKADDTIRRLQKNVVVDEATGNLSRDPLSAVLKATSDIDVRPIEGAPLDAGTEQELANATGGQTDSDPDPGGSDSSPAG